MQSIWVATIRKHVRILSLQNSPRRSVGFRVIRNYPIHLQMRMFCNNPVNICRDVNGGRRWLEGRGFHKECVVCGGAEMIVDTNTVRVCPPIPCDRTDPIRVLVERFHQCIIHPVQDGPRHCGSAGNIRLGVKQAKDGAKRLALDERERQVVTDQKEQNIIFNDDFVFLGIFSGDVFGQRRLRSGCSEDLEKRRGVILGILAQLMLSISLCFAPMLHSPLTTHSHKHFRSSHPNQK